RIPRVKRFIKKTERKLDLNGKETVGFDRTKIECYNCHRRGYFARECRAPRNHRNRNKDAPTRNAPVDTSTTNALVVQNGIDSEIHTCSKECLKSYETLQKHDQHREALNKSNIEIIDKTGLGYDSQMNESDLNDIHVNESEVLNNVVDSHESNGDDNQVNYRFKKGEGYHAVPPPYTWNYMPPRADLSFAGLDNSVFKSKVSEAITSVPKIETNASKTILTKSGQVPINTAKQRSHRAATSVSAAKHVNTAASRPNVNNALPTTYSYFKAHSPVRRLFNQKLAAKTNNFIEKVNTAKVKNVTTARKKAIVSTVEGNQNNAVKSSTCWIWRPKGNLRDHISKDSGSYTLKRFNYVDSQRKLKSDQGIFDSGCSRYMTRNKSYIIDYQEINGEVVAFRGNAKGGKITRKDTECVVLSPDFKLPDERQVLLKVPRNNNMLGHINFKTMNKLVRGNLARDLPSKIFENNHTCVACQKGKPHKASCLKSSETKVADDAGKKITQVLRKKNGVQDPTKEGEAANTNSTNRLNTVSSLVNTVSLPVNADTRIFSSAYDDEVEGAMADFEQLGTHHSYVCEECLYGTIKEEVYVCQPPGFEDSHFSDKVYKVEKVLYGLHQAPRAWYETLSTYLLENKFRRGIIDNTLFIKKDKDDILLVQVYVDDIIFGSTKKSLCTEFEGLMHKKFQMSFTGELTFFLGLQVMQRDDGIFICQDKYMADILKKFNFSSVRTISTPIETNKELLKDEESKDMYVHLYRLMIGSLMYLTASRHDIMFAVCACARFQVTPKVSHLHAVKRIFR
nr:uncharacterized mitochondrial protein AtMg00810-like [Tanacetum cinerariifolium]